MTRWPYAVTRYRFWSGDLGRQAVATELGDEAGHLCTPAALVLIVVGGMKPQAPGEVGVADPDDGVLVGSRPPAQPRRPYGVFALGLNAFSEVLTDWPGGGRVAIHGTSNPGDGGHGVSHGCVHVYDLNMARLAAIPLGTPVTIRS